MDTGRTPDGHCVRVGVCFWLCGGAGVGVRVSGGVWRQFGGVCGGLGVPGS